MKHRPTRQGGTMHRIALITLAALLTTAYASS